jgi:hypothetical protein
MQRIALVLFMLLASLGAGFGGAAIADDVFPDVPTSNPFHDEISEFGQAGCADGFPDGTYHPTDPVKRQQIARFFTRCGGRVVSAVGSVTATTSLTFTDVASVNATPPADGFMVVTATGDANVTGADLGACPCLGRLRIFTSGLGVSSAVGTQVDSTPHAQGNAQAALAVTHVFAVAQGDTRTYTAQGQFIDDTLTAMTFNASLTVLFVPFGA